MPVPPRAPPKPDDLSGESIRLDIREPAKVSGRQQSQITDLSDTLLQLEQKLLSRMDRGFSRIEGMFVSLEKVGGDATDVVSMPADDQVPDISDPVIRSNFCASNLSMQQCGMPAFGARKSSKSPTNQTEDCDGSGSPRNKGKKDVPKDIPARLRHLFHSAEKVGAVGQFQSEEGRKALERRCSDDYRNMTFHELLTLVADSPSFEVFFGFFIFLNTLTIALEVEYDGLDNAFQLGLSTVQAADAWPWAPVTFYTFSIIFGVIFLVELVIKIIVLRRAFVKSWWNLFDTIVIASWMVEASASATLAMNPTIFRLARLLRLLRVARNFRTIHAFDSLNLLIGSISACSIILWWSTVLLTAVHTMVAMFINLMLDTSFSDTSLPKDIRDQAYLYFGTFGRSYLTMFEISMGNWVPVCRFLMDNYSGWWGLFMLIHKLTVGFAVIKVITGVFLQSTFACAASDDDLMVIQKERAAKILDKKMHIFLGRGDENGDDCLDRDEFRRVLSNPKLASWLSAMEIEVGDADVLYSMIDNGDGQLSLDELVRGVSRLRGSARSVDVCLLLHHVSYLQHLVEDIRSSMQRGRPHHH